MLKLNLYNCLLACYRGNSHSLKKVGLDIVWDSFFPALWFCLYCLELKFVPEKYEKSGLYKELISKDNVDLHFENKKVLLYFTVCFLRFESFYLVAHEIVCFPSILKKVLFFFFSSYRLARHLQKEAQAQHNNSEFTEEQKVP